MFCQFGCFPVTFEKSLVWLEYLKRFRVESNSAFPSLVDTVVESPQLSPLTSKEPLCMSPSFQMSTLSLPSQAPSPLQSPLLSEVGSNARLEEEEEGRRKVHCSHAILATPCLIVINQSTPVSCS